MYFCSKHVLKVPEHKEDHPDFHKSDRLFPEVNSQHFEHVMRRNIDDLQCLLRSEIHQLNNQERALKIEVQQRVHDMTEDFTNELSAMMRCMHFDLNDAVKQRRVEGQKNLDQCEDDFRLLKDYIDDVEHDSFDFISTAATAQTKIRTHQLQIFPVTEVLPAPSDVFDKAFGPNLEPLSTTRTDGVNKYWRDISAQKYLQLDPAELPRWNLQDLPIITVDHPDKQKLGAAMISDIFLRARILKDLHQLPEINTVSDLELLIKEPQTPVVLYEGDDGNYHRMAVHYMTERFVDHNQTLTLQVIYEPPSFPIKQLVHRFQERFHIRNLDYYYKKSQCGLQMNTFMLYCQDYQELDLIKDIFDKDSSCWSSYGLDMIKVYNRSNIILSYLDKIEIPPVIVTDRLMRSRRVRSCPEDMKVSSTRPAMAVEIWLDRHHPTSQNKNYDPYMKQILFPETSREVRHLVTTSRTLKVEFVRPLAPTRQPWAWIGAVKAAGEQIENRIEHLWVKRTGGFPITYE